MYILTFKKSKSKKFQHALNHAASLGATYDGEEVRLEVRTADLIYLYEKIIPLLKYIQHWKSAKATYNGRPVPVFRFLFQSWHDIRVCAVKRMEGPDDRHCWMTNDLPGWGCHKITKLQRYNTGTSEYEKSNRYWYNYGEFDDVGQWHVNKPRIYEVLMQYVEEQAIDSCPYFCNKRLWETIQDLPELIRIDNANYRLHYIQEYEDGRKVLKPVNIRHQAKIRFSKTPTYRPQLGPKFSRN